MPRKPKQPPSAFNGTTIDLWQASKALVSWARSDPAFADVLAVVQNGFSVVPVEEFAGYRRAFNLLLSLRLSNEPQAPTPPVDYRDPPAGLEGLHEQAGD